MKFVLASHNQNKLKELRAILSELNVEVVLQSELGLDLEPDETGTTFAENALIKAKAVMEASGLPAIADDSGLCVDKLGGAPGVYSARYGGEGLNDAQRTQLLLRAMSGQFPRTCHFSCAVACAFPNGDVLTAEGKCQGTVAFTPMGTEGFGYDPVFFVPSLKKTFAQLDSAQKNAISHRGKALAAFATELEQYLKSNETLYPAGE